MVKEFINNTKEEVKDINLTISTLTTKQKVILFGSIIVVYQIVKYIATKLKDTYDRYVCLQIINGEH